MRLDYLCDLELLYRDEPAYGSKFVLLRPYGSEEGSGYGELDGAVTGNKLRGTVRCVNHPHRRSDGMMLPNAHGIIRTHDDATICFSLQGRTFFEDEIGKQLLTIIFETDDPHYAWLNQTWCILEGIIDGVRLGMRARIYQCVHELDG
jgi:hypothetical protein